MATAPRSKQGQVFSSCALGDLIADWREWASLAFDTWPACRYAQLCKYFKFESERELIDTNHNINIPKMCNWYRQHAQHAQCKGIPSWSQSSSCPLQKSGPWSLSLGIAIWVLFQELFQGHVFIERMRRGVKLHFRWSVQATSTVSLHQTGYGKELPGLVDQAGDGAASKIYKWVKTHNGKILTTKLYNTSPTWRGGVICSSTIGTAEAWGNTPPRLINLMAWHEGWCRKAPPLHCHTPCYNMMTVVAAGTLRAHVETNMNSMKYVFGGKYNTCRENDYNESSWDDVWRVLKYYGVGNSSHQPKLTHQQRYEDMNYSCLGVALSQVMY